MSNVDNEGYIHDRYPSNNRLVYTAIYKALTGYDLYMRISPEEAIVRTVRGKLEPTSLDEIIGAIALGILKHEHVNNWHWAPHNGAPWYRVAQALIYCAGKDRNFFKYNNVEDIHRIAYWIPWHIQYWILKRESKSTGLRSIAFYLWLASTLLKPNYKNGEKQTGNISQKNIAWVMLKDMNIFLWFFINYKKNLKDYFGSNHIITKGE